MDAAHAASTGTGRLAAGLMGSIAWGIGDLAAAWLRGFTPLQ